MNFLFLNHTIATLASGIAAGATTATLAAGSSGLFDGATVDAPIRCVLWNSTNYSTPALDPDAELVDITGASGTAISAMVRGRESTVDANHNTSGRTYKLAAVVSAEMMTRLNLLQTDKANFRFNAGNGLPQWQVGGTWYYQTLVDQGGGVIVPEYTTTVPE
jgi:hypothetical protein